MYKLYPIYGSELWKLKLKSNQRNWQPKANLWENVYVVIGEIRKKKVLKKLKFLGEATEKVYVHESTGQTM